jgi:hypothetical protein
MILGEAIVSLTFIFLPLVLGVLHASYTDQSFVKLALRYYLIIVVGIQGCLTGIIQIFSPEWVVDYVKWPDSPFLKELGMANLAFGIVGFMGLWLSEGWKNAALAGYLLFLFFTGVGHLVGLFREAILLVILVSFYFPIF